MTRHSASSLPPPYRPGVSREEAHRAPALEVLPPILDVLTYKENKAPYPPRVHFGFLLSTKDLYELLISELGYPRDQYDKSWPALNGRVTRDILTVIASQIGRGLTLNYLHVVCEGEYHWCLSICTNYNRMETKWMRSIAHFFRCWFSKKGIELEPAKWYLEYSEKYAFWRYNL